MAVYLPVEMAVLVEIVPVAVEEAVVLARAAAALTALTVHEAFQFQHYTPPDPVGPGSLPPEVPPMPRQVTQGEQNLATKIADQLHQDSKQELTDPSLQGTVTAEKEVLIKNEAIYRSITTQMTAVQAATIAAPGVPSIQSSNAYILQSSKQPSPSRDENLVNAERLLASLATVSGTV